MHLHVKQTVQHSFTSTFVVQSAAVWPTSLYFFAVFEKRCSRHSLPIKLVQHWLNLQSAISSVHSSIHGPEARFVALHAAQFVALLVAQ